MKPKAKKAQITAFIIIAILLLFSVYLVFYTKSRISKSLAEREILEEIPQEFLPVKNFVESCIEQKAIEGLNEIGRQGGYTNPAEWGFNRFPTPSSSMSPTDFGYNSVYFSGAVPYWWYVKDSNTCQNDCKAAGLAPHLYRDVRNEVSLLKAEPSILSIEVQLDEYINKNLKKCVRGFATLPSLGFDITEKGNARAKTTVAEENVIVEVEYPIEIKKGDSVRTIKRYRLTIPLNLKRIYEEATRILKTERKRRFLEMSLINLIAVFQGNRLPYLDFTKIGSPSGDVWLEQDVRKNIELMLSSYVQLLRVTDSKNYQAWNADPLKFQQHFSIQLLDKDGIEVSGNPNLETRFFYHPGWPIYMNINEPDRGLGVVTCESGGTSLLPIFLYIVKCSAKYDVSYPVIVTIEDKTAFNGRGYSFSFALEACIRNNEPCGEEYREWRLDAVSTTTMFCSLNQITDCPECSDAEFYVVDAVTSEPIEGAIGTVICNTDFCPLGSTDSNGRIAAKIPPCLTPLVAFEKPPMSVRYYQQVTPIPNTGEGRAIKQEIALEPAVDIKISAEKRVREKVLNENTAISGKSYKFYAWRIMGLSQPKELEPDIETAIIKMVRKDNVLESTPEAFVQLGSNEKGTVTLMPGKYEVTIQLYRKEGLAIPPDFRKRCAGSWPVKKCVYYWIPEKEEASDNTILPPPVILAKPGEELPSGGAIFNENSGYIEITRDMLKKDSITFYAISHNLYDVPSCLDSENRFVKSDICTEADTGRSPPRVIEDVEFIFPDLEKWTGMYRKDLEPRAD